MLLTLILMLNKGMIRTLMIKQREYYMKAILLCRVSSKDQEEGHSLVAQSNRLHEYCSRKGLEIIKEFTIVESSTRGERPEFQKLIDFIKQQKEKIALVCDKVDRLQRSFREVPILEGLRKSDKLVLHFISENQVLDSNANNSQIMAYQIFVMMAENYTNCISDNVKRSFEKKLKEGTFIRESPVGYLNTIKNGVKTIIIDPERGPKVKDLFEKYAAKLISIRDMVLYAKKIGLAYKSGRPLSRSQIHTMLHNPFYYGYMRVNGKLYKHIYEPLITKDLFDRCNGIAKNRHPTQSKSKKEFLLSGLVRCGFCNKLFSPYMVKHKYLFLQAPTYKPCHHVSISAKPVMDLLNEKLKALHLGRRLPGLLKLIDKQYLEDSANHDKLLLDLNDQEQVLNKKKSRLMDLYLEQGIGKTEYEEKNQELETEIANIRYRRSNLNTNIEQYYKNLKKLLQIADNSHFLINSSLRFSQKAALLRLVTSNCWVESGKVQISLKKPLETILDFKGCPTWLGQLDSNQ